MRPITRVVIVLLPVLLVFAACTGGGGVDVAQVPTATLAPIVSMTPRFTATPVASRTPLPTFTYTPSDTPIPPTPSDTPTPTEVPPVIGIISSRQTVNVREGPGVSYRALTALSPGTGVEVLGQSSDGSWYNILMDDGSQGWVSSSLLFLEPTQTPFPTMTATVDETAIALGTTFPTAILGGNPVTPTPPPSVLTPGGDAETTGEPAAQPSNAVIDLDSFNATATALVGSITGGATQNAQTSGTQIADGDGPVGGPTGGPVGGATATRAPGQGQAGQTSAQEGADVLAYCDDPLLHIPPPGNLAAGSYIDVYWSWYARTEAQIDQHRQNVVYEVAVDGNRLTNWRLYAEPQTRFVNGDYYQYWFVPYGPLSAGEHTISYRVTWREAITDGYDDFGPGTSNPEQTGTCTFTVR